VGTYRWARPADLPGFFRHVGHDTSVKDAAKQRVFHFPNHATMPKLRVGCAFGCGINKGARYIDVAQYPVHLRRFEVFAPRCNDGIEISDVLHAGLITFETRIVRGYPAVPSSVPVGRTADQNWLRSVSTCHPWLDKRSTVQQ